MILEDPHRLLVTNQALPPHLFRKEIQNSWHRCLNLGFDPFDEPRFDILGKDDLTELREQNELVRRLALIEMKNLHNQIAGSNFVIIFANKNGIILDSIFEDTTPVDPRTSKIAPGNVWGEDIKGTNALGLVSSSAEPRIVHGQEHYFVKYADLTCAAAPIFDAQGKMAGIIDATSDCRSRQRHTLALVKMSCLTIENSLFRNRFIEKFIIEFHSRHEFLGTLHSGMLAFEKDGRLIQTNRQAKFLLEGIPLRPKVHFDELFSTPFNGFLDQLHHSLLIQLTDIKGSTFAVKAFNFPPKRYHQFASSRIAKREITKGLRMIHDDRAVKSAINMVERAVTIRAPILIRGETGTGKELLANYVHKASGRRGRFIALNCAALPETLIESELFGYADGAFTGAISGGSVGLVQQADKGTLFLDEIGAMPFQLQAKTLRFLDRWQIRPLGASKNIQLDIQLISASNSHLVEAVHEGKFREDLLYRINTVDVLMPPLRERTDFDLIVQAILDTFNNPPRLESEALQLLKSYSWPGNIRELNSFITRLVIGVEFDIISSQNVQYMLRMLPLHTDEKSQNKNLADQELDIVLDTYTRHNGNISAVARELGISRNKVYKKLKEARS